MEPDGTNARGNQSLGTEGYALYNQYGRGRWDYRMASTQRLTERETSGEMEKKGSQAMGPAFMAAAASVGLSWYYFFARGDKERGLFVGLWPPTILAFASYFNQRKMSQQLDMLAKPASSIKNTLESMMSK